ncbi:hypothetical protein [Phenylobacterium sp.]|jgi:hypothetical protein|uniref:hypothetical protein n=1 Tax=Phenylobacterium sp. TaxID=1871053 RepID=UPI000C8D4FDE|nr:hypothetical protein [Phenylobacterium sp.]MAK80782.1 hypothetical protein [Phenylobacterium sp.]|tara:strand:- start:26015 stop:27466 length:1452 start_codon:yes stop_codon:yes gene_type:complete
MQRTAALLLGLVIAAWTGQTSLAAVPHPLWSSDELRAARSVDEESALVFDVQAETSSGGETTSANFTVTLAPSFTFLDRGPSKELEDHWLCRSARWNADALTLEHVNCHALVGFLRIELVNRQMLGRALSAASEDLAGDHTYLSEAELGVQANRPQRLRVARSGDVTEVRLGRRRVAVFEGSATAVTPDEARRVRRFFARNEILHPQVRAALPTDALPALIGFERSGMKLGDDYRVLRISNARRVRTAYPLPEALSSDLVSALGGSSPREQALARSQAALSGAAVKPEATAIKARFDEAVEAGRALHGLLLLIELSQLYPEISLRGDPQMVRLGELMDQSLDVAAFDLANSLAGDPRAEGDREAAARFLVSDTMASAPFNTFRYVTYANLIRGVGDTSGWDPAIAQSMPASLTDAYWLHVVAYPWASGAYKDVGDAYFGTYQPVEAWAAYDLGRAVDPGWASGPMKAVETFERQLRAREPDFF